MKNTETIDSEQFYKELSNGNWGNKPTLVINPFKRKEARKLFLILGAMVAIITTGFFWKDDLIKHYVIQEQQVSNDAMKTEMQKLADEGKVSAILWMVSNYPKTEEPRLDPLLKQNNAEALLLKAQLTFNVDRDQSFNYIKQSALEGNALAIKFLSEQNIKR